jgi:hypothetical protein
MAENCLPMDGLKTIIKRLCECEAKNTSQPIHHHPLTHNPAQTKFMKLHIGGLPISLNLIVSK